MKKKDDWKVILLFLCFMVAKKNHCKLAVISVYRLLYIKELFRRYPKRL